MYHLTSSLIKPPGETMQESIQSLGCSRSEACYGSSELNTLVSLFINDLSELGTSPVIDTHTHKHRDMQREKEGVGERQTVTDNESKSLS